MFMLTLFFFGVISLSNYVEPYPSAQYVVEGITSEEDLEIKPNIKLFKAGNKTYYFSPTFITGTFFQAMQFCNSHNMKLLSIETKEENDIVIDGLRKFLDLDSFYDIWTSGTRLPNDEWIWLSTGYNIVYYNWDDAQPDDSESEPCILAYYEPTNYTLVWHDYPCNDTSHIVCENSFTTSLNISVNYGSKSDSKVDDNRTTYAKTNGESEENNTPHSTEELTVSTNKILEDLKELRQEIKLMKLRVSEVTIK